MISIATLLYIPHQLTFIFSLCLVHSLVETTLKLKFNGG